MEYFNNKDAIIFEPNINDLLMDFIKLVHFKIKYHKYNPVIGCFHISYTFKDDMEKECFYNEIKEYLISEGYINVKISVSDRICTISLEINYTEFIDR